MRVTDEMVEAGLTWQDQNYQTGYTEILMRRLLEAALAAAPATLPEERIEEIATKIGALWSSALETGNVFQTTSKLRDALSRLSGWVKDAVERKKGDRE